MLGYNKDLLKGTCKTIKNAFSYFPKSVLGLFRKSLQGPYLCVFLCVCL